MIFCRCNESEGLDLSSELSFSHMFAMGTSGKGRSFFWENQKRKALVADPKTTIIDFEENPTLRGLKPEAYYLGTLIKKGKGCRFPRGLARKLHKHPLLASFKVHMDSL